jgi:hypothetical protein
MPKPNTKMANKHKTHKLPLNTCTRAKEHTKLTLSTCETAKNTKKPSGFHKHKKKENSLYMCT